MIGLSKSVRSETTSNAPFFYPESDYGIRNLRHQAVTRSQEEVQVIKPTKTSTVANRTTHFSFPRVLCLAIQMNLS